MKNLTSVLLLVLIAAGLSSCEKIKNLFEVEIDTTIEGDLSFVTDETELKATDAYGFDAEITVHVINDDLYEYESEIEDFMTSDITVEVLSVDSSGVLLLADSKFEIYNENAGYAWTLTTDWPIEPGLSITLDAASYDAIDDILNDRIDFKMAASGTCNKGNVTIELRYGIETTVITNPSD